MAPDNQITRDAERLRAIAAQCDTLQEFWKASGMRDIQSAHAANDQLKLKLPIIRQTGRTGTPKVAQACPKSVGKGKGAKPE